MPMCPPMQNQNQTSGNTDNNINNTQMQIPSPRRQTRLQSEFGGGHSNNMSNSTSTLVGRKRDSAGFAVGLRSPAREGGNLVKLFVGCVPRNITEDDIRPLFAEQGNVLEVVLVKDKRTGQQQGCCFIKYATLEEAERAIKALHNQHTLPGGIGPIQVRHADGDRERLGAVEHKLFVRSLNRQATEKEIEKIFSQYGCVEYVYILRDDQNLSRGCAFVKYTSREMATDAINKLNGIYIMEGCDYPLTVQFAEPKTPKGGDTRFGPAFGGYGPRLQRPVGFRPASGPGRHFGAGGPPSNWRPMGAPNTGPPSQTVPRPYVNQMTPRGGPPPLGGPTAGFGFPMNSSHQGSTSFPVQMGVPVMLNQQQGFNPPPALQPTQAYGQQPPSQQLPQTQQQLPGPVQHQHQLQQPPPSYPQVQHSQQLQQHGQLVPPPQQPLAAQQQAPVCQLPDSQQSLSLYGQLPISQPQGQQHIAPTLQHGPYFQQQQFPIHAIQPPQQRQQLPIHANQKQSLPVSHQQPASQPVQQQQSQTQSQQHPVLQPVQQQQSDLQSHFPSQQAPPMQQQLPQMQTAAQSQQPQPTQSQQQQAYGQGTPVQQPLKQQSSRALAVLPQAVASTAGAPSSVAPVANSAPAVAALTTPVSWTEHTSPEGNKYYYNTVTGESKWEKPEELTALEKQQQLPQQPQLLPESQAKHLQQQPQPHPQQQQTQIQQYAMTTPFSGPVMVTHQHPVQTLGYGQLQGVNALPDPTRHQVQQHGMPTAQEWMWKARPAGT